VNSQPTVTYPPQYYPTRQEKEPFLALLLSFLLAGLGQIYVGKVMRGIFIILGFAAFSVGSILLFYGLNWVIMDSSGPFGRMGAFFLIYIIAGIVMFIVWIWQLVDAYNLAERYNEQMFRTGSPPW
jgi:TM2 domain-containing membrane protein YozV